jgi:hypothetical protein
MEMTEMIRTTLCTLLVGGLLACSAQAATLVYEGFADYTEGDNVVDGLNGGFGFASAWEVGQQGGNPTVYDETAATDIDGTSGGELSWDGVYSNPAVTTSPAVGSRFLGGDANRDRLNADRVLSQSAGDLAGADNVLWASIVWYQTGSNYGRQVGFTLGTDGLANRAVDIDGSGDGIGVGGAFNSNQVTPAIFENGPDVVRTTAGAPTVTGAELVVLKFTFADGTDLDTVEAWSFAESDTISEAQFNANAISASYAIDQDTLNVLSVSQSRGTEALDEIRLGDTFADVLETNTAVIPEPASLAMGLVGFTLIAARRRRA